MTLYKYPSATQLGEQSIHKHISTEFLWRQILWAPDDQKAVCKAADGPGPYKVDDHLVLISSYETPASLDWSQVSLFDCWPQHAQPLPNYVL